jgi:hypothetical protein
MLRTRSKNKSKIILQKFGCAKYAGAEIMRANTVYESMVLRYMEYFALGFLLKFHHNLKSFIFRELTRSSISLRETNLNLIGGILCLNASCK